MRSQRALRAALGWDETRGVKNLRNFLGVIEGFLRSLSRLGGNLGGDESRLLLKIAELFALEDGVLSMVVVVISA